MKYKILIGIMSLFFLFAFYPINVFCTEEINEIEDKLENIEETSQEIIEIEEDIYTEKTVDEILILEEEIITEEEENKIPNEEDSNITKEPIIGTMNLEKPQFNSKFTKGQDDNCIISGWAVSNDINSKIIILIDENIVVDNAHRYKRGDVDNIISPNYGGVSCTPNAGFEDSINISNLSFGNHILKVQEIDGNENVITEYVVLINIDKKSFKGTMYVENPQNMPIYTRDDNTKLKVSGWAVSEDREAFLRILVDGKVIMHIDNRYKREDVDNIISPNYGGVKCTLNAGFNEIIDISHLGKGIHEIKVDQISRYGDFICDYATAIEIKNKQFKGTMFLDTPQNIPIYTRPDDTKLKVSGWAVSEDKDVFLRILVDGKVIMHIDNRYKREDVDNIISPNYGGATCTPNAGFTKIIDISNLDKGIHEIRVDQISRYGDFICDYASAIEIKNKQYKGTMFIETPQNAPMYTRPYDTKLNVSGWAVSEDNGAFLRILVDGKIIMNIGNKYKRGDVDNIISPNYGGTSCTPNAGFYETIDISNLDKGLHIITVQELSRYGDLIVEYNSDIHIQNKKYNGEMFLDSPSFNNVYEYNGKIAIAGWAVSEDENATVDVYIDNNFVSTCSRYYREDVMYYMNKYGSKTIDAGFGRLIECEKLTSGNHKIKVYEKSRYGDVIGGIEVAIYIKSKPVINTIIDDITDFTNDDIVNISTPINHIQTKGTMGIDVSQFQGNIDWNKVANNGVKYAMIRLGYRGYGTGGLAEDTKFKTNFKNAVASGIKVGVYFYSAAINSTEAKKDAEYVISVLKKYGYQNQVSMPIAIDLELVSGVNTRDKNISKSVRTSIANTFCSTIKSYGYTPMVYACKSFLNDNMYASQVNYDIWVAQYNSKCTYSGNYTIWQYTSSGKISGINGNVDCNYCYKNY